MRRLTAYLISTISIIILLAVSSQAQPGTISTVAGGYTGDGGPAIDASIEAEFGIFVDADSNIYVADEGRFRVRRIDSGTGLIETIAGGGEDWDWPQGNGGPALDATVFPEGVFVDAGGDSVYVSDSNGMVRLVDINGTIDRIAGGGNEWNDPFGDGGQATDATFQTPQQIVKHNQYLYVVDKYRYKVRRIDLSTGIIETVAGNGTNTYSGDGAAATAAGIGDLGGIAIDPNNGDLYLADMGAQRVRKVSGGIITTFAGGGVDQSEGAVATAAQLNYPKFVFVHSSGDVYISDSDRIRMVSGGLINTVAGGGGVSNNDGTLATDAVFGSVNALSVSAGRSIYFFENDRRLRKINGVTQLLSTIIDDAYTGDGLAPTLAPLRSATDVFTMPNGDYYIADQNTRTIRLVSGGVISTVAGSGGWGNGGDGGPALSADLIDPNGLFVHPITGELHIASRDRIRKVDGGGDMQLVAGSGANTGYPHGDGGPATSAYIGNIGDILIDSAGHIYYADRNLHRVRKIDYPSGTISTIAGVATQGYSGDGAPASAAELNVPTDVEIDGSGNIYIADRGNRVIRKIDASSPFNISTVAGGASAGWPDFGDGGPALAAEFTNNINGLYVDGPGNMYVADESRVRKVSSATGTIARIAGQLERGYGGDGGQATDAFLHNVDDIAPAGNFLLLADWSNDVIRSVDVTPYLEETTAAAGPNGNARVVAGSEVRLFSIGVTADGDQSVSSIDLTISDLTSPTGLAQSTFTELRLYASDDHAFDGGDALLVTVPQASISIGSAMSIAGSLDYPTVGLERFYIVTAVVDAGAAPGTAMKVGFPQDGLSTSLGGKGTAVIASDADRITVSPAPVAVLYAGTGNAGFSGDGSWGFDADLNQPNGPLYADPFSGALLFGDEHNRVLRRMDSGGLIGVVAGQPFSYGDGGDNGDARDAQFKNPDATWEHPNGDMYVVDWNSSRVRRIDGATGIITTVAGNGTQGYSGDTGQATSAQLNHPRGVVGDGADRLFIADTQNNRIRVVNLLTGVIDNFAGGGDPNDWPSFGDGGLATDAHVEGVHGLAFHDGSLYIAETYPNRVRKIDAAGIITRVAGSNDWNFSGDGGPAVAASFRNPIDVAVDAAGNVFVADEGNHRIRRVDAVSGVIETVAGSGAQGAAGVGGPATAVELNSPRGVAVVGDGDLYIADANNYRILRVVTSAPAVSEWVPATGPTGEVVGYGGSSAVLLAVGLEGNGTAAIQSVTVTLSDLTAPTGLLQSDIVQLELYRSADQVLGGSEDVLLGTVDQANVNIGSPTTIVSASPDSPPGTQWYYLVAARLSNNATAGHGIRIAMAAGGVSTSAGPVGSAVVADDANYVHISSIFGTDTFDSLNGDFWQEQEQEVGLTAQVTGGELVISGTATNTTWGHTGLYSINLDSDEIRASVDVKVPTFTGVPAVYGLRLNFGPDYFFRISYDENTGVYGAARRNSGGFSLLNSTPAFGDEQTVFHNMSLEYFGNTIRAYVDGNLVESYTDPDFTGSYYVSLVQESNDTGPYNMDVRFDNFDLASMTISASAPTTGPGVTTINNPDTGQPWVELTYSGVSAAGTSSASSSLQGDPAVYAYQLGTPPDYLDISTTATYSGNVNVCVYYDETHFADESTVTLFHNDGGGLSEATSRTIDTALNKVCGDVVSLSPFALFEANQAPWVNQPIADRDMAENGKVFRAELNDVFGDATDALSFSAFSNDGSVADAQINGSELVVTPGAIGTATITVDADDGNGNTTSDDFVVTVAEPPVIPHIAQADLPTMDGDVSDWEALFAGTHLGQADFTSTTGQVQGPMDPADNGVEIWYGWNSTTNLLYVAARITDDFFGTNSTPADPGQVWRSDDMELYVDADNSGGDYDSGNAHAQQYIMNPEGTLGPVLYPHQMENAPNVTASITRNGTEYIYEISLPGWDLLDSGGTGDRHIFADGEVLGLGFAFADFESNADADNVNYRGFNTLYGRVAQWRDADQFPDMKLGASGLTITEPTGLGNAFVDLTDGGATVAALTFANVTSAGNTTLQTSGSGPAIPANLTFGDPPYYLDLSTTALFSGAVEVCIPYDENEVGVEGDLRLHHHNGTDWIDITSSLDIVSNEVCGTTTTLSPFAVFVVNGAPELTTTISNKQLTARANPYVVDLSTVFSDPNGDVLEYSTSTTDNWISDGSLNGSQLTVQGNGAGTATITVEASDGTSTTQTTFDVTVKGAVRHLPKTNTAPTLDGTREAIWDAALELDSSPSLIGTEHQAFGISQLKNGPGDGAGEAFTDADVSATTRFLWDDVALYYLTEVRDNHHDVSGTGGANFWWERDGMALFLDLTNANDSSPPFTAMNIVHFTGTDQASGPETVTFEYTDGGGNRQSTQDVNDIAGLDYGFRDAGSEFGGAADYVIEGKISWSTLQQFNLPGVPVIGDVIGASMIHLDADGENNSGGQIQTWGWADHPSTYTDFKLAKAPIMVTETTTAGADVVTTLTDPESGETPAEMVFENVITEGETTLETSTTGPAEPSGFQVGEPPTFYDIETTAVFAGAIEVCVNYDEATVGDETQLMLFHFADPNWEDITTSLDVIGNELCGSTTSLSPFGVFEPASGLAVSIPDASAKYAESISVPVEITDTDGRGIVAAEIFVTYDGDLLLNPAVNTNGTILDGDWTLQANILDGNGTSIDTIKAALATGVTPLSGAGALMHLTFDVDDRREPAATPLVLEHVLLNSGSPVPEEVDGSFTLTGTDGVLFSNPPEVTAGELISVQVTDPDENRAAGVADFFDVRVDNDGQTETVTVTETSATSGVFQGVIATEFSVTPSNGDGTVQAVAGDQISFCYDDLIDAAGATVERCDISAVRGGEDGSIAVTTVSQPGDTARVVVSDPDLNTNQSVTETATVSVVNDQTGEQEDIDVTETSSNSDVFFGIIKTTSGGAAGAPGDDVLNTKKGDQLSATYADALTSSGGTANVAGVHKVIDPFGDADGNGNVQAFDAAQVLIHRLNPFLTGNDSLSANVDFDAYLTGAQINAYDASLILQRRVGLLTRFEVQEDESSNHPQPETDNSVPRPVADERVIALQGTPEYFAVVASERGGIVSGELDLEGVTGTVQMAEDLSDFLVVSKETESGMRILFAGAVDAGGIGELLRIYPEGDVTRASLRDAVLNDGRVANRIEADASRVLPMTFALYNNQPNPFNPSTSIRFDLPSAAFVEVAIYDILGQRVRTLMSHQLSMGAHQVSWDGRAGSGVDVASGVYFYRMTARHAGGEFVQMKRMLLLK